MRLIICGASGYIGKRLVERARAQAHFEVLATSSRPQPGAWLLDLARPDLFDANLVQANDVLVLAAAISSPDVCEREHARAWATNVTGTAALVERIRGRGARVIFLSSDTVYGEQPDPFDERMACKPAGPYAEMKHEVERRFSGDAGFRSLRLSYVFSAADRFTRYLADCAARGMPAEIFDPFVRAIVHREDVVEVILAMAQRWPDLPQGVLNVGGPAALSRAEYAATLRDMVWPHLQLAMVTPDAQFFRNRPRHIAMQSPELAALLGRSPRTLAAAAAAEPLSPENTHG